MALASITFEKSGGPRLTVAVDVGDLLATDIGRTWSFRWNGVTEIVKVTKAFRLAVQRALDTGEVVTLGGLHTSIRRLVNLKIGQSDEEGRMQVSKLPRIVNRDRIGPLGPPWDENQSGPGGDFIASFSPLLLDRILSRPHQRWNRGTIVSTATGTQTIASLLGPGGLGLDGTYRLQLNTADVCGGPEGSNPRPIILPGDDFFITFAHGESDSPTPSPVDYAAQCLTLLARAVADFPSSNCIGIVIFQLEPSPHDLTPRDWSFMRAQQASMHDPTATPKRIVVPLQDNDRQLSDLQHLDMGEDDTRGGRRIAIATCDAMVQYGMVA